MPDLVISMLGPFQVSCRGRTIQDEDWPSQKSKYLLKILAAETGRIFSAEKLIDLLWPDLPLDNAQNNLWVTVSQLRRVLEPDLPPRAKSKYVLKVREGYCFNAQSSYWLDVDAFRAKLSEARQAPASSVRLRLLREAKSFYNGQYLEEDPYEDWAAERRQQLENAYLGLLQDLADLEAQQGHYESAVQLCQEALAVDKTHELFYARLMVYYFAMGDRPQAIKTFETCRQVLVDELGVEPSAETQAILAQVQAGEVAPPAPVHTPVSVPRVSPLTSFVGRATEYDQIKRLIDQLDKSSGHLVLIEGEPGIGKSRMVQEAMQYASGKGLATLKACCYQIEQSTPFQPISDLIDQALNQTPPEQLLRIPSLSLSEISALVPEINQRIPGLEPISGRLDEARQARLVKALSQFFIALAAEHNLVLIFDDLHWADNTSLRFIHHFTRQVTGQPVLILCTYREEELQTNPDLGLFVDEINREPQVTRIRLNRLSLDSVRAIVNPITGASQHFGVFSEWIYGETAGNPFFLVTILQSLIDQGLLSKEENARDWSSILERFPEGSRIALPDALRESIRTRLRHLSKKTRQVLDAASVLRHRFEFPTLQAVLHQDSAEILEALEDLISRRLLFEDGRSIDFSHDKIREVVYLELSMARRIFLHRAAAAALEGILANDLDEFAGTMAEHYEQGQVWDKALAYHQRAAARSRALFAVSEAAFFYDRAVEIASQHPDITDQETLAHLNELRGEVYVQIGDFDRAAMDLRAAMEYNRQTGDHQNEHRLLLNLGMLYRRKDEFDHAREHLEDALLLAREEQDHHLAAETLYHLGTVAWSQGNNYEALRYHQEAVDLCEKDGITDLVAAQAIHGLGEYYWLAAKPNRAIELFNQSIAIARKMNDKGLEDENLTNLGAVYLDILKADYPQAQKYIRQALDITIDIQLSWHAPPTLFILALSEGSLGNYASALEYAQQAVGISERLNSRRYLSVALDFLGDLYQDLNLNARAEAAHTRGLEIARASGAGFWLPALQAGLAIDRIRQGQVGVETDLLEALQTSRSQGLEIHSLHILEALAELECARADPGRAILYADQILDRSITEDLREKTAQARRWRSAAFLMLQQVAQAESELDQAMRMATLIAKPRLQYDLHKMYARLYEQQGDQKKSRKHVEIAEEISHSFAKDVLIPEP